MSKLPNIRKWTLRLAIVLAISIPIFMATSALGSKYGLWDWRFGFGMVRGYGVTLMKVTALIAIIALLMALFVKPRKGWLVALLALAVPVSGMGFGKSVSAKAKSLPFIHDVSTDTQDPPTFSSVITTLRGEDSNSLIYVGKTVGESEILVSDAQAEAYPDIKTIIVAESPGAVFTKVLETVDAMGWALKSETKSTGVIEATSTSFWFGFKDDVVIRIRPADDGGSLVDVRSISRVGGSDIGVNAQRIREFTAKLTG
jgi:uncharacterized protein (DUF1499 family)